MPHYDIRELQLHILKMLLVFDKICREHNLHYYILFGTMLGAVRHKGFIPWDDDIDVGVPRGEYQLLIEHAGDWFPEPFEFLCYETNPDFVFGFGKMQDAGTTIIERGHIPFLGGAYIDIFPIDGISSCALMQRVQYLRYSYFKKVCYLLQRDPYKHGHGCSSWIPLLTRKLYTAETAMRGFRKVMSTYSYDKSTYVSALNDGMTSVMPKSVLGRPTPIEFEGHTVMGVEHPDDYLSREFGDYMRIPDEKHRISHNFFYLDLHTPYRESRLIDK